MQRFSQIDGRMKTLLFLCKLNIASQIPILVKGEWCGYWMSFANVGTFIQQAILSKDLPGIMTGFGEDFDQVPPFLLALGMAHPKPLFREWIIPSAIYCTNDQLKALALALPEEKTFKTLELILDAFTLDKYDFFLSVLPPQTLEDYLNYKGTQFLSVLKKIQQNHTLVLKQMQVLRTTSNLLEQYSELHGKIVNLCNCQYGLIRSFETHQALHINHLCQDSSVSTHQSLLETFRSIDTYKDTLMGSEGFFKKLDYRDLRELYLEVIRE